MIDRRMGIERFNPIVVWLLLMLEIENKDIMVST